MKIKWYVEESLKKSAENLKNILNFEECEAGIPLYAVVCFAVCAVVAAILRRIPFIGRFIC